MRSINSNDVIYYLYKKIVGAGFSFSVFIIFLIINTPLSLFELSGGLTSPWLWVAFYGYGVLCSMIIDGISKIWPSMKRWTIYLYIFAGIVLFTFPTFWAILLIAGPIGATAALLFYIGVKFVTRNKWTAFVFAIILPVLFIVVSMTDFTKKENWEAVKTETTYEAEFTYFDGEHKIPIQLKKGDKVLYKVVFYLKNDGGWGNHFENAKGQYQPMEEQGDMLVFTAQKDGEYYIVVGGNKANGRFVVDWEIASGGI